MNKFLFSIARLQNSIIEKKQKNYAIKSKGSYHILVLFKQNNSAIQIVNILNCRKYQIEHFLYTHKNKYSHFYLFNCSNKDRQEHLFMTLSYAYPKLRKRLITNNKTIWQTLKYIKKTFHLSQYEINKKRSKNPDICLEYNGIEYWHVPYFKEHKYV